MLPVILNINFIKRESKISYPQDSNWGPLIGNPQLQALIGNILIDSTPDWEPTVYLITGGVLESWIYPSINSWDNPGDTSLSWNCASVLKSHIITQSSISLQQNKNQPPLA